MGSPSNRQWRTYRQTSLHRLEQSIENGENALIDLKPPIIDVTGALADQGGLADALAVVTAGTDAAMLKIAAPNASLVAALDTLGIKSTEMKNSELADLEQAVRDIEKAVEDGTTDIGTLEAAQQAYADALGGSSGATEKTNEWGDALTQISTIATDFGADLAEVILKGGSLKEIMTGASRGHSDRRTAACRRAGDGISDQPIHEADRLYPRPWRNLAAALGRVGGGSAVAEAAEIPAPIAAISPVASLAVAPVVEVYRSLPIWQT